MCTYTRGNPPSYPPTLFVDPLRIRRANDLRFRCFFSASLEFIIFVSSVLY